MIPNRCVLHSIWQSQIKSLMLSSSCVMSMILKVILARYRASTNVCLEVRPILLIVLAFMLKLAIYSNSPTHSHPAGQKHRFYTLHFQAKPTCSNCQIVLTIWLIGATINLLSTGKTITLIITGVTSDPSSIVWQTLFFSIFSSPVDSVTLLLGLGRMKG